MRHMILILLLTSPAHAGDREARILCATETANASNIMMMRQNGHSYQQLAGIAQSVDPVARTLYLGMVNDAFQRPAQRSLSAKREAAYTFGQEWGARCRARIGI